MQADFEVAVQDHIVDLWEEDGDILALIELIQLHDHVLIENLAVHPDHQGEGLGKALLQHAEVVTRSLNLKELRLYTNILFTENVLFYAKSGYEEFKRDEMIPGSMTVHLRKRLI